MYNVTCLMVTIKYPQLNYIIITNFKKELSNHMKNKKQRTKKSFLNEYKWIFIFSIIVFTVIYYLIYQYFSGNYFNSFGQGLDKKDWISFFGSYISFSGTLFISLIAILQSDFFTKQQIIREDKFRKRNIQPIFSIDLLIKNQQHVYYDDSSFPPNPHKYKYIKIKNVNDYPIRNLIIFDKYFCQLQEPNQSLSINIIKGNSHNKSNKNNVAYLSESKYEFSSSGFPKYFNIYYDDVDGNKMMQTFELKKLEKKEYYSLKSTKNC